MTDEEEAEEYADWFWGASPSEQRAIKQAYLDGLAEGRKDYAILEKENAGLKVLIKKLIKTSELRNIKNIKFWRNTKIYRGE